MPEQVLIFMAFDDQQNMILGKQDAITIEADDVEDFRAQLEQEHNSEVYLAISNNLKYNLNQ